jgi:lipoprotein-releasing system permease protein
MRQKDTFSSFIIRLAILATTLSVTVMILSVAVVSGFEHVIKEKLFSYMGHVHVSPYDPMKSNNTTAPPIKLDSNLLFRMRHIPHVAQVTPFAQRPVILQAHGQMEGIQLKGVGPQYHFPSSISLKGKPIDYSDSSYSKEIILSENTASLLDLNVGDTIRLEFLNNEALPRIRRVRIAGLYHSGLEEVDKYFGLCDMRLLQRMNTWGADSINAYQLDLEHERYADTIVSYIHYNLIAPPIEAYTTVDNDPSIFDWLRLQSLNGLILLVIVGVVAVINLGAVLLILIVYKARMVGLFKAMGMHFRDIARVFLYIAGLIGGTGIVLGNIVGLGLCLIQQKYGVVTLPEDTYFMKYAPVRIEWAQVLTIDLATLAVCVACMWLPSLYIRKIQPAKVLQFK